MNTNTLVQESDEPQVEDRHFESSIQDLTRSMASLSYSLAPMSFEVQEKAAFAMSFDEATSINKVDNDNRATTSTMTNGQTSRQTSNNNNNKGSPSRRNRVAFGSCNEQDFQNNLWPITEERKPDAFIWGGNAIYAGMLFLFVCLCGLEMRMGRL